MATNTLLTSTKVVRKALAILHQKLNFIGSINRQYDSQYAQSGAKDGATIKLRLPNQYTVRTGKNINVQGSTENSVSLVMGTQKGVDIGFSSQELTLDIDDFAIRFLEPAMSVLASNIEADVLQARTKDVYNLVGTPGTVPNSLLFFGNARGKLNQYLAPKNSRKALIDSPTSAAMVEALKGLFQDSSQVAEQYREGMLGRTSGFDFLENESIYVHANGTGTVTTNALDTDTLTEGDTTANINGFGNAGIVKAGSVFTIAGVYAVHPETKQAYSHLQQFVVTADVTASAGGVAAVTFSPALNYSNGNGYARQNVSAAPSTTAAVVFVGAVNTSYGQNLAFHRDAFAFVSADLEMPEGVHFAAREQFDGLSMRIVRAYDINSDNFPCRIDVLYGSATLRAELAVRVTK
jgi:hypothetical protein